MIANFYFNGLYKNEIVELIKKIVDIFNFEDPEKELKNPTNQYFKELIDLGLIEQKDLKEEEKRLSLSEEEEIFWKLYGYYQLGNNIENWVLKMTLKTFWINIWRTVKII